MLYKFLQRDNNVVAVGDIDFIELQSKLDANYSDFGASTLERYMEQVLNPSSEAINALVQMVAHPKFDRLRAIHGSQNCNTVVAGQSSAGTSIRFRCDPNKYWNRIAMFLTTCKARGFHDE